MNLSQIEYDKRYLFDMFYNHDGYIEKLFLMKSFNNGKDHYYFRLFLYLPNGKEILLGYLYFFIDENKKESKFIGCCVKNEYRNQGIASLLISSWLLFCLDNNIIDLNTNRKQSKPFLLYLLKNFSFEINNPASYNTSLNTIYICQKYESLAKILLFKGEKQREMFEKSTSFKKDNYEIIDNLTADITVKDEVMLDKIYSLNDQDYGYQRALKIHQKFR